MPTDAEIDRQLKLFKEHSPALKQVEALHFLVEQWRAKRYELKEGEEPLWHRNFTTNSTIGPPRRSSQRRVPGPDA